MNILRLVPQLGLLVWSLQFLAAAAPQKTTDELIEYIRQARQLGLKDDKIRQNAVAAGWEKNRVEEAFTVERYLTTSPSIAAGRSPNGSATGSAGDEYRIGAGDVLQIVVRNEPETSVPNAVVRPDGKITIPMVKDVDVVGMVPLELEKLLIDKLQKFVRDAEVTVIVKQINSLKVNLFGAVKKEGPIPLQGNMTVLQAINEAGGLTDYAKRKRIYVLRLDEGGRQSQFPFDYEAVLQGKKMEQNIVLRPNDMIVVPQ